VFPSNHGEVHLHLRPGMTICSQIYTGWL